MGDVIDFKSRTQAKIARLLDRAGINDMLIERIVGVPPTITDDDTDPNNPNNRNAAVSGSSDSEKLR